MLTESFNLAAISFRNKSTVTIVRIAYDKIPSFIVTLAGMLVFRGLTLALLGGNSIGPFAVPFQQLSSGFIPDLPGQTAFRITSMAIGALVAVAMFYNSLRRRLNREKHGFQGGSFALFVLENLIISGLVLYLEEMGVVIGAFIMRVMNNGMSIMGVGIDWQQVVKGPVLLDAVIFDVYNKNKA